MKFNIKNKLNNLISVYNNTLHINSFFLISTSVMNSAIGFLFWLLAARIYSTASIGINTTLISTIGIITMISLLGFEQSIIRFFPEFDKSRIFSTSIIVTSVFSTVLCIIFISTIDYWSPSLSIIKNYAFLFYIFLIANIIAILSGNALIALKKSKYYFVQNIITGSRLILLLPFLLLGILGIFYSFGVSLIFTILFSLILLYKLGIHPKIINIEFIKNSYHFSSGIYIFNLLTTVPSLILSIIVLNLLGAEQTAYYFISFTMASILYIIPSSFGISLFVEGSHGEPLKENVLKSIKSTLMILIPSVILLYLLAPVLLQIIGHDYLNALNLLRLMILSSFFMISYYIFVSINKIQKDVKTLIFIGIIYLTLLIGLSYIFMLKFGLIGIGYGWVLTYGLVGLIILIISKQKKWI